MKTCPCCQESLPEDRFHKNRCNKDGLSSRCTDCRKLLRNPELDQAANRRWRRANPERNLYHSTKNGARRRGIPFDISPADIVIPEVCPVLGIRLEVTPGYRGDSTPTVDRRVNELGYTPDNIIVISWRANRIKSDATPEELDALARFYAPRRKK